MAILGVSAGQSGITSNWPQVQQALDAYVKVRNQSTYDSVLEKMRNIAFKAAEYTEFSAPEKIRSSIANIPNKGPKTGGSQYVGQYKVINWERKIKGMQPLGGSRFRKVTKYITKPGQLFVSEKTIRKANQPRQIGPANINKKTGFFMDGKYKKFIQSRVRGSKWLRIGWALAADKLGKPFGRGDFGEATKSRLSGKAYGGGAEIKINGAGKFEFEIYNGVGIFDHRYRPPGRVADFGGKLPLRPANQIANARKIQERGLQRAVIEEIKEMAKIIIARTSKIWNTKGITTRQVKAI